MSDETPTKPAEIASLYGVTERTVRRWRANGDVVKEPDPGEPLLSIKQLAIRLRVSERSIYRWKKDGLAKPVPTPGGMLRFRLSDLIHESL